LDRFCEEVMLPASVTILVIGWLVLQATLGTGFAKDPEANRSWQRQWAGMVREAKKEGRLNIHITRASTPVLNPGVFQKAYPEIKVRQVVGRGNQVLHRVLAERRASRYLADVFITGVIHSTFHRPQTTPAHPLCSRGGSLELIPFFSSSR